MAIELTLFNVEKIKGIRPGKTYSKKELEGIYDKYKIIKFSQGKNETIIKNSTPIGLKEEKLNPKKVREYFGIEGICRVITRTNDEYVTFLLYKEEHKLEKTIEWKLNKNNKKEFSKLLDVTIEPAYVFALKQIDFQDDGFSWDGYQLLIHEIGKYIDNYNLLYEAVLKGGLDKRFLDKWTDKKSVFVVYDYPPFA